MRCGKSTEQERLGSFRLSCRTEEEFERVSVGINSSIEVHPRFFHFDIGLIDAPGVGRGFEMGAATSLQFWCIALYPTRDGG